MTGNRMRAWLTIVLAAASIIRPGSVAWGQESGTLLYQTVTLEKATTDPVLNFQVATGKSEFTATEIFLEIGSDGNAASPPTEPTLPGGLTFTVRRTDVPGTVTFPLAGGSSSDISGKLVSLTRGLEASLHPMGLYALQILHEAGTTTTEAWEFEVNGLAGEWRIIAAVTQGTFTGLTPTGPCTTGCPEGQVCMPPPPPCPSVCPVGQSCREPCPWRPCVGPFVIHDWPVFRIPPWPPDPVCLSCPEPWMRPFDDRVFERIIVTFVPTAEQRIRLEREQEIQFHVTNGELIGGYVETDAGELMQLVQYRRGQPPTVSVTAAGITTDGVRAAPPDPGVPSVYRSLTLFFGLLLVAAIAALATMKRRLDRARAHVAGPMQ